MASQVPLLTLARLLVLIGGIVLLIGGILEAINVGVLMDFGTNLARLGSLTGIVVGILVGILALAGSREVANPAWSLILLILGLFVGSLGGILVFIGGLNRPHRPLREDLTKELTRNEVIILRD
jgi:hypothetical protein